MSQIGGKRYMGQNQEMGSSGYTGIQSIMLDFTAKPQFKVLATNKNW